MLTADDFGKNEQTNEKILELAEAGKLDRVSVMAGGDFGPEEIGRIKKTGVKLDIHLELDWQKKKRRMTKDNTMRQGIVFLANHFRGNRKNKENGDSGVRPAWKEQIEKFREVFGRYPDGLNSHEYVHLFPPYFRIALELARECGIPFVRFGKKGLKGKRNMAKLVLNNLRKWNRRQFVSSGLDSSDYFASLDWIKDVGGFVNDLPDGKTEIACHPEREDELDRIRKYF